jgi:hypothetical protein
VVSTSGPCGPPSPPRPPHRRAASRRRSSSRGARTPRTQTLLLTGPRLTKVDGSARIALARSLPMLEWCGKRPANRSFLPMERAGIEPATSGLQSGTPNRRSPAWLGGFSPLQAHHAGSRIPAVCGRFGRVWARDAPLCPNGSRPEPFVVGERSGASHEPPSGPAPARRSTRS